MKLSVIIPAYNEEKTVKEVIEKVRRLKLPVKKEIIVVDDGSTDKTFERLKKVKGIKLLKHTKNQGKGAAVRSALKKASGDVVIIQDADLELDPEEIPKIIQPILRGKAEVVYGSRNLTKQKGTRSPIFYLGGKLITLLTNFLYKTKITDEPCGYKAFKTGLIKSIKIENNRFEWEPEITAKIAKKGVQIHEVPINSEVRSIKEGKKLTRMDGIKAALTLIKYRFKK
jgi:glycosyltransferase involved in cell wall biosynthesis